MQSLFDHHIDSTALLREIDKTRAMMGLVSPHGHLGSVRAAVYLLHGAGDTVIPPSETQWLAQDLPPGVLRRVLISPAMGHVELGGDPSIADEWAVVDFLAAVLSEVNARRP
jgi:pimeloyl-ACP methyl ester carboxylesterase